MTRIGIVSPCLTEGDAVSNDVLGMQEALMRDGRDVRIFAEIYDLNGRSVSHSSSVGSFLTSADDVLIYHHARGWSPGLSLLRELRSRKVIKYHNVTPARFYAGFDGVDEELCETGRAELAILARAGCDLYLADSEFNQSELVALGAHPSSCFVVPPFHRIDRLTNLAADQAVLDRYRNGTQNILAVGRLAPHKGHLMLLEIFAQYYYNCNRNARLIIVGKGGGGLSSYVSLLHRAADSLGIKEAVVFTGGVSEESLKAYYMVADAFVTTSEHEGFCVPLVEAMSMKLPISAFACAAIPETLGDAGVAWRERDPALIAETLNSILADADLRTMLGARAFRRYRTCFTEQIIEATFLDSFSHVQ